LAKPSGNGRYVRFPPVHGTDLEGKLSAKLEAFEHDLVEELRDGPGQHGPSSCRSATGIGGDQPMTE
jgi:hypothetical protein